MRALSLLALTTLALGCDAGETTKAPPPQPCSDCFEPPPVQAHQALTPLIGGTLAVSTDGARGVVADPESHQIFVVDLKEQAIRNTIAVPNGEPGRVTLDDDHAYVALRTGGVVRVALDSGEHLATFDTCAAPRGVALDGERLHVACAGGDLQTFDAESGALTARVHLEADLRDVVVGDGRLWVTTFRSAQVLAVEDGRVVQRFAPRAPAPDVGERFPTAATVAWRTIGLEDGGLAMLHQRSQLSRVVVETEGGYGSGDGRCSRSVVSSAVTIFDPDGAVRQHGVLTGTVLATDLAGTQTNSLVIAAPGAREMPLRTLDLTGQGPCLRTGQAALHDDPSAQATSVAIEASGAGWALLRAPTRLLGMNGQTVITLNDRGTDTGHELFHRDAGGGIACASCHPEGGDDGHTWLFQGFGLRRTQHLRGGLLGSEPFHWEGDLGDMSALVDEVMVKRMGGEPLTAAHSDRLLRWIDAQPRVRVDLQVTNEAVARGAALFADPTVGCTACHGADGAGNNRTYDVGTGGYFQVPKLAGLKTRAPYLHDGCATTLHDRFGACGGGDRHGRTSQLTPTEIDDLVAYLETL